MADTGWVIASAGSNVDNGGAVAWSNPGNVTADDGTAATCNPNSTESSDWLRATFDLSALIPVGATIDGVEVRYQASRNTSGHEEESVRLVVGGSAVGADKSTGAAYTATPTNYDRGGAADLWSTSITRDQAVATDFGFQFFFWDSDGSVAETTSCDAMWIKVYYTEAGSTTGDGALTLPKLTTSGAGGVLVGGTGGLALPLLSLAGAGASITSGDGALGLPAITLSASGSVLVTGSGALTLPSPLGLAASGAVPVGGSGNCGFPQLVLSGAGHVLVGGSGNLNLTKLRTSGSGAPRVSGSGNLDLPVLELAGSNEPPVTTTGWFLFSHAETGPDALPEVRRWITPTAALVDDASSAYVLISGNGPMSVRSAVLSVRNPIGISIPSGSEITSIDYKISRLAPSGTSSAQDYSVRPIKGGVPAGDEIADPSPWVAGATEVEYGGSLMGLDWGAGDFGSDFGLSITIDVSKQLIFSAIGAINAVWGRINFASTNPIVGSGAIELPIFTMDSPPIPTTGTSTLTLPSPSMKAHSYNALCSCCEGYTMRTLLEIRRMLVQQSGHFELVLDAENEDWGDNGADQFIQAGQRFCDDQWQHHKSEAWLYVKMASGESLATFTNARIIKEVWLNKTGGPRTLVERLTLNDIRDRYTDPALAEETTGTPLYWAPAVLGLAPQQFEETALTFEADGITDYDLIMFGNHYPYKGLYVMPPCDGDYTLEIKAEWQSHEMCDDADVSFWSQYPELLLLAARREMEIHLHRNTTGAQDFERPLLHSLQRLYHNLVAEESSGPTKIRRG